MGAGIAAAAVLFGAAAVIPERDVSDVKYCEGMSVSATSDQRGEIAYGNGGGAGNEDGDSTIPTYGHVIAGSGPCRADGSMAGFMDRDRDRD